MSIKQIIDFRYVIVKSDLPDEIKDTLIAELDIWHHNLIKEENKDYELFSWEIFGKKGKKK